LEKGDEGGFQDKLIHKISPNPSLPKRGYLLNNDGSMTGGIDDRLSK